MKSLMSATRTSHVSNALARFERTTFCCNLLYVLNDTSQVHEIFYKYARMSQFFIMELIGTYE